MPTYLFQELQFTDNNENLLSNGTIETYLAGTLTPTPTYTNSTGSVSIGNAVPLDVNGRPNNGNGVWLDFSITYKFIVKDSVGTVIQTINGIGGDIAISTLSYVLASSDASSPSARVATTASAISLTDVGKDKIIDIPANSVNLNKLTNIPTSSIQGRGTAGSGIQENIPLGSNISSASSILNVKNPLDLSGSSSLKIPISATPTVSASGHLAIDSNSDGTVLTDSSLVFHDGTSSRYILNYKDLPTSNSQGLYYNSTTKQVYWSLLPGASGVAPTTEGYLTLSNTAGLSAERSIVCNTGITATDAGANSTHTIKLDINSLTEDTTPDSSNDYAATYDSSALVNKKTKVSNVTARSLVRKYPGSVVCSTSQCLDGDQELTYPTLESIIFAGITYAPVFSTGGVSVSDFSIKVTYAGTGATIRLGIYASDTSTNKPTGSPLVDSGDILVDSTGRKTYTTPFYFVPGILYYVAVGSTTTAPYVVGYPYGYCCIIDTIPVNGAAGVDYTVGYTQTYSSGALPTVGSLTARRTYTSARDFTSVYMTLV